MDVKKLPIEQLILFYEASKGNPKLQSLVKSELINRRKPISKEFLFSVCRIGKRPVTLIFSPWSEAFKNYGASVTVDVLFDKTEEEQVLLNYHSIPPVRTFGVVRLRALVITGMEENQLVMLKKEGIDVSDVLDTRY